MPGRLKLELNNAERDTFVAMRDTHPCAYMRERGAALLKICDGQSGRAVADHGLYKKRAARTIYEWVNRFNTGGLAGLSIKPGRGRHPAFSPSVPERTGGQGRHPGHHPP